MSPALSTAVPPATGAKNGSSLPGHLIGIAPGAARALFTGGASDAVCDLSVVAVSAFPGFQNLKTRV